MRDRQTNEAVALRLDVERHARMLRLVLGLLRPGPGENQPAWRRALDDLADDVDRARVVERVGAPSENRASSPTRSHVRRIRLRLPTQYWRVTSVSTSARHTFSGVVAM